MAPWLEAIGVFARPPDLRSRREVDDEIRTEIEFHLEERARDLERDGLTPVAARDEASRRFGDRVRIERACRAVQIGERIMLQRIQSGLLGVLVGVVGWLAWQSFETQRTNASAMQDLSAQLARVTSTLAARAAAEPTATNSADAAYVTLPRRELVELVAGGVDHPNEFARAASPIPDWYRKLQAEETCLAKLNSTDDWRVAVDVGEQIAKTPDDFAVSLLTSIWPRIVSSEQRRQLLKPFAMRVLHPKALAILDLAANDPDLGVQGRAFHYLRSIALTDFSADHAAYESWYARYGELPIGEVLVASAHDLARRLRADDLAAVAAALRDADLVRGGPDSGRDEIRRTLQGEGLLGDVVGRWMPSDDETLAAATPRWLALLDVGFPRVRSWLNAGSGRERIVALLALSHDDFPLDEAQMSQLLDSGDREAGDRVLERLARSSMSETLFEQSIAPRLRDTTKLDRHSVEQIAGALARTGRNFAVEPLTRLLLESPPAAGYHGSIAAALGAIGDARAIPTLLAVVDALGDADAGVVAKSGLAPLCGVSRSTGGDQEFWRRWWNENRTRLPAGVGDRPLPVVAWRDSK